MGKTTKKTQKKEDKKSEKYNADNEIIIGVNIKPKSNVRADKKSACTTKKKTSKNTNLNYNEQKKKNKIQNKNKLKKEEEDKKKKIKKKNKKRIIISIITLILIAMGEMIFYLTTPKFNVSNIIVYGNEKVPTDTYISLTGINVGDTNIFAFTNNSINEKLKENAYVEEVKIKRKLPDTLEIYVTERQADYQINYSDKYIYLNKQGYILEINEKKQNIPSIQGLDITKENIQVGQRVNNDDLLKLEVILKIVNYCKYNNIENELTSFNVQDTSNYILNLEKDKKIVYLGDASNLSERILWLKTVLEKEDGKKGKIFINGDLNKDKVYFREEK